MSLKKVPSLLSLGNNMNGPGGNFGGQPNFGPSGGRFNDRAMRHPMKNQRPQPYNKVYSQTTHYYLPVLFPEINIKKKIEKKNTFREIQISCSTRRIS